MMTDRFELRNRQLLSALIDGELRVDEARFLMRRLEHDEELSGCHERWQLLGDVLRGGDCVPAPLDFAGRVGAAIAAAPLPVAGDRRHRPGWRWSGGVAIAASVAALALFVSRERLSQAPAPVPAVEPTAVLAVSARMPAIAPAAAERRQKVVSAAVATAPDTALASAKVRHQDRADRHGDGATGNRQSTRSVAVDQQPQDRAVAQAEVLSPSTPMRALDPFAHPVAQAPRPWPRSVLAEEGALNASLQSSSATPFYPFEPRLPTSSSGPVADDLPPLSRP